MNVFKLIQKPIIKIIAISMILYFGLFANKENPKSLGNRLSKENIKENLSQVKQNGKFIFTNLKMANEYDEERKRKALEALENIPDEPIINETKNEKEFLLCGDLAKISYVIYNDKGMILETEKQMEILMENQDNFLEKNILGMKKNEIKMIFLNKGSQDNFQIENLAEYVKLSQLVLQVRLIDLVKKHSEINCN